MQGALPVKPERQRPLFQATVNRSVVQGALVRTQGVLPVKPQATPAKMVGRGTWEHVGRSLVSAVALVGLLRACRTGRSPDHAAWPGPVVDTEPRQSSERAGHENADLGGL